MGTTRSCLMLTLFPGGGFGIFTDRDQQSTFWGFEFRKSVFIWALVKAAVLFGCKINPVFPSILYF